MLPPQSRVLDWFTRHRAGVERAVDWFWYVLIAAALVGVIAAFARRNRPATSLLPIPLALAALYVLFFAEARYHLPVAVLLMPFAGAGLVWVGEAVRDLARFTIDRQRRPRLLYEGVLAAAAIVGLFVGWPRMLAAGTRLRTEHRWAVAACSVDGARQVCEFRPVLVQGPAVARARDLGRFRDSPDAARRRRPPRRRTSTCPPASTGSRCAWTAATAVPTAQKLPSAPAASSCGACPGPPPGSTVALVVPVTHAAGGKLHLEIRIDGKNLHPEDDVAALWIAAFEVESERR